MPHRTHLTFVIVIAALLLAGCNRSPAPANDAALAPDEPAPREPAPGERAAADPAPAPPADEPDDYTDPMPDSSTYPRAIISTEFGDITVELWNDVAPNHVENFLKLARTGFYDNLTFHRVIPGFVIQGGCPQGTGTGGPGWTVDAEFSDRPHEAGTLSMARSQHPNSAGSQFFICLTRQGCRSLDGQYTAFGQVIEGMDVVERLGSVRTGPQDRPLQPLALKGVKPIE